MSDTHDQGLKVRREVMGDAFVDRALGNATDFTQPLQDFVNEHAWGGVWTRDGLDRKTRSLITLSALTALKCPQELKGHVRGALNNGCTVEEIRETLLHCAVYAGVPAAIDAFRAAPRAWPSSRVEAGLTLTNTCSTAASVGWCRRVTSAMPSRMARMRSGNGAPSGARMQPEATYWRCWPCKSTTPKPVMREPGSMPSTRRGALTRRPPARGRRPAAPVCPRPATGRPSIRR